MSLTDEVFDLEDYKKRMYEKICNIMNRPQKSVTTYDILDSAKIIKRKLLILKEKQRQMKMGEIWQMMIGEFNGFVNLGNKSKSGLDILSHTKKIAIELKSRTNTDNASSKKSNFDKLAKFKKENPEYTCIYATINANTKKNTWEGFNKKIVHNEVEIEHWMGYKFLDLIFGDDLEEIIQFIKNTLDEF